MANYCYKKTKLRKDNDPTSYSYYRRRLAGSEAAWQIAEAGIPAIIHEMKPQKFSAAHKNPNCAELVCSNSLRSDDFEHNAVGLLHEEMRRCGSLIMACADATKVPAEERWRLTATVLPPW